MNRLETIKEQLTESDPGYFDWFGHDALVALVAVAEAAREWRAGVVALRGEPPAWATDELTLFAALAPLLKEV